MLSSNGTDMLGQGSGNYQASLRIKTAWVTGIDFVTGKSCPSFCSVSCCGKNRGDIQICFLLLQAFCSINEFLLRTEFCTVLKLGRKHSWVGPIAWKRGRGGKAVIKGEK
jgi:hypothetical protein